jgi:hypothetical protein
MTAATPHRAAQRSNAPACLMLTVHAVLRGAHAIPASPVPCCITAAPIPQPIVATSRPRMHTRGRGRRCSVCGCGACRQEKRAAPRLNTRFTQCVRAWTSASPVLCTSARARRGARIAAAPAPACTRAVRSCRAASSAADPRYQCHPDQTQAPPSVRTPGPRAGADDSVRAGRGCLAAANAACLDAQRERPCQAVCAHRRRRQQCCDDAMRMCVQSTHLIGCVPATYAATNQIGSMPDASIMLQAAAGCQPYAPDAATASSAARTTRGCVCVCMSQQQSAVAVDAADTRKHEWQCGRDNARRHPSPRHTSTSSTAHPKVFTGACSWSSYSTRKQPCDRLYKQQRHESSQHVATRLHRLPLPPNTHTHTTSPAGPARTRPLMAPLLLVCAGAVGWHTGRACISTARQCHTTCRPRARGKDDINAVRRPQSVLGVHASGPHKQSGKSKRKLARQAKWCAAQGSLRGAQTGEHQP